MLDTVYVGNRTPGQAGPGVVAVKRSSFNHPPRGVTDPVTTPGTRRLSCGCCTNGCCCSIHLDVPNGRRVRTCARHAPGALLSPRNDVRNHSPDGFQWGYGGSGPAQLALALCLDVLGARTVPGSPQSRSAFVPPADEQVAIDRATAVYQVVKGYLIANLHDDAWTLEGHDVMAVILSAEHKLGRSPAVEARR